MVVQVDLSVDRTVEARIEIERQVSDEPDLLDGKAIVK